MATTAADTASANSRIDLRVDRASPAPELVLGRLDLGSVVLERVRWVGTAGNSVDLARV